MPVTDISGMNKLTIKLNYYNIKIKVINCLPA